MSEFTTEQVLDLIEQNGGSRGIDLRGRDLSGVDLSYDRIWVLAKERGEFVPWALSEENGVELMAAHLERVNLVGAHLEGANLSGAHLNGAILYEVHLERATLQGADLRQASLPHAHLERADLRGAHLEEANLTGAHLERADLRRAYLQGAHLTGVYLDNTQMTRESLEDAMPSERYREWVPAKELYLALKQNFTSLGHYEDAAWAYVKERQMERKSFFPSWNGDRWMDSRLDGLPAWLRRQLPTFTRWLLTARLLLWPWSPSGVMRGREQRIALDRPKWLRNTVWWLLCNYGESVLRPLVWGAAIVAAFGLSYLWLGGVKTNLELPPSDIADYFLFSARCFATIAFNDLQPAGIWGQLLSAGEGVCGVATLALVMYCLGRRMSGA